MREINSTENRIVRQAASLSEKKYRDSLGLYLIEGPNFIRDALKYGGRLRFIFMRAGIESQELSEIIALAEKHGPAVTILSGSAFEKICDTKTSQGVVAVAEKRVFTEEEFFGKKDADILVLDRLQDPGNLGTLLRSAEAFGFGGVLLMKGCADIYGPKLVRAAAGSLFRLPVFFADTPKEAAELLARHGKKLFSTVMQGGTPCYEAKLGKNAAIVIGNEGTGVCREFIDAGEGLTIPMTGDIESLNAGLAGGIIMYEAFRQIKRPEA